MPVTVLSNCSIFRHLDTERVERVASVAEHQVAPAGSTLFAIGTTASRLYVVMSGSIELSFPVEILGAERAVVVQACATSDVFAWSALVPPHRFTLSGRAAVDSELLAFPRQEMLKLFDEDPVIGRWVMTNLSEVVGRRLGQLQVAWARGIQRTIAERYP